MGRMRALCTDLNPYLCMGLACTPTTSTTVVLSYEVMYAAMNHIIDIISLGNPLWCTRLLFVSKTKT